MINRNAKGRWVGAGDLFGGLTLFFSSFLFFYDLFDGRYLLSERDLAPYFIPPRFFWVESIKAGNFPFWNPYQFSGQPLFANPQHAVLYPLNVLFFIFPFDIAFNAIIIFHFFLGGLFTYLFVRDLKVDPTGALLSGLIFMLGGYLLSVHSLLPVLLSVIWTPLIMMFFRRALLTSQFKNQILTSVTIALSFLAGGLEVVYGNFLILLIMIIFQKEEGLQLMKLWHGIRKLIFVTLLFLFLSAIQFVPFLELFYHSIRGRGISYQEATVWSFAPKDFLLFFLPDAYGYFLDAKKYWTVQCWLKTLYIGGLPFILSPLFLLFRRGRGFYLSLVLLSVFLALGQYNPVYPFVFKYVPFFNGIRYPVKFLYIFILCLSIISGIAFQSLVERSKSKEESKSIGNLFILFSLFCGLVLLSLVLFHEEVFLFLKLQEIDIPNFTFLPVNLRNVKRFFVYLTLFFLLLRIGQEVKWKGWARALLVLLLIADLFGYMGFYGKEKTAEYFEKTRMIEILSSDKGKFRTFSTPRTISTDTPVLAAGASYLDILKDKNLPCVSPIYELHDIWGNDVMRLRRLEDFYRALVTVPPELQMSLISLCNVKYIVSIDPDPRFELVYSRLEGIEGQKEDLLKKNTIKLYKNPNQVERAWLVEAYRVLDADKILPAILTKDFRRDQLVFLEEEPTWERDPANPSNPPIPLLPSPLKGEKSREACNDYPPLQGEGQGGGGVQRGVSFVSENGNSVVLRVESERDALLVLSDTHFPGWKVYVDGAKKKIYRANYTFRAVPVGAGTHRVEFIYDPLSFKIGAVITILGIIGCVVICLIRRKPANKKVEIEVQAET